MLVMKCGDVMGYLALYRKYRPNDLTSVVGQEEIKKILATSVKRGTITHAYLFSGPRGTGKTTMAKILAKMVNCEHPIDGNPCNNCNSCLNLLNSNDVIEIDAASNNGVDEIRDLREKANLVPSTCKYKVYIIDEVHMLTTQAFNALLKTLEEPPKHVIFILATTEYHKIPLTITSRCQKFQFNKIDVDSIVGRLREIANNEKINIDDDALYEIAKISDGGMRDSINFLDQLRSFDGNKITINDVYDVCGNVSFNEISTLFVDIKNNNAENVTLFFEKMNANGKNYGKFLEDVVGFLKDVILYKKDVNKSLIKCDINYVKEIAEIYDVNQIFMIVYKINVLMERLRFVSRQSIVVISSFLLIMNDLNQVDDGLKPVKTDKQVVNNDYELAFKFTSNEKEDGCKLTEKNDIDDKGDTINNNDSFLKNKDVIINNAFSVADKKIKANLQDVFVNVNEYLTDKKYAMAASLLVDTKLEVAGNGYIILTGNYDAIVDKINRSYKKCEELLNVMFSNKYNFVVITTSEWDKYREEYIKNVKSGKKYVLQELDDRIIDINILNKEPTVVDKLFELVGEDSIEFK